MRVLLRFVLILFLAWGLQLVLPFWSAAIAAFLVGLGLSQQRKKRLFGKNTPPARAFLAGFLAIFLLWSITAWILDSRNESVLSGQIYELLFQSADLALQPGIVLILLTGLVGGLIGGLSAMTGNLLGEAVQG